MALTHELRTVLTEVFKLYAPSSEMTKAEADVFLTDINLRTDRGSEMRFAYKVSRENTGMERSRSDEF